MGRRVVYNTAATLDGYIADPDNSLAWLFAVDSGESPSIESFMEPIGALVSGSTTYEWVLREEDLLASPEKWSGFYGDRPWFVFTSRDLPVPEGADVRFVSGEPSANFEAIAATAGENDVWLFGGGELVGQVFDDGLLTEIQVTVTPTTLGGGAPLLPRRIGPDRMRLVSAQQFGQFAHLTFSLA